MPGVTAGQSDTLVDSVSFYELEEVPHMIRTFLKKDYEALLSAVEKCLKSFDPTGLDWFDSD